MAAIWVPSPTRPPWPTPLARRSSCGTRRRTRPRPAPAVGGGAPVAGSPLRAESDLAPKAVGTRPCETEIRTARPGLGTVVYFAVGRVEGAPVVVLGFASGTGTGSVSLLALAQQEGCRVVLEAVGP